MVMRRFFSSTIRQDGGDFEPEYQAVLDRASFLGYTTPDSTTNNRNNARVKNLKDIGVLSLMDVFYIFDNPSGLSDFSKINYVSPSSFELFNSNPALEPDFIADSGFKSDGTKWFNTGFRLVSDAVNISASESSFGFKGFDWVDLGSVFGARTGNNTSQLLCTAVDSTSSLIRLKSSQNATPNYPPSTEFSKNIYMQTIDINNARVRKNGVDDFSCGQSTANFSDLELYLLAVNENDSAISIANPGGLSYFFAGGQTDGFQLEIYEIMEDIYTP